MFDLVEDVLQIDCVRNCEDLDNKSHAANDQTDGVGDKRMLKSNCKVTSADNMENKKTHSENHYGTKVADRGRESDEAAVEDNQGDGDLCAECCAPQKSCSKAVMAITACGAAGVLFGWCMEKSRGFLLICFSERTTTFQCHSLMAVVYLWQDMHCIRSVFILHCFCSF